MARYWPYSFLWLQLYVELDFISVHKNAKKELNQYLTIIPRAWMGYWLRGYEGERNNCFSKIQLVGEKYREWKILAS